MRRVPVANLADAARVLREAANAPVLYGWHDGSPGHFGRGVIRVGLVSDVRTRERRLLPSPSRDLPAHIEPWPFTLWNRAGIAAANTWLTSRWCRAGPGAVAARRPRCFRSTMREPISRDYGAAGMIEAQWLVAHATLRHFAGALAECVARDRPRIALIASKLFPGRADGFSFDGAGVSLAIQMPSPADERQRAFIETLAEIALAHGGRANLIKESTLDAATARRAIAGFDAARTQLAAFNPGGLHASELARRLAL